ncbi:peptidylprolyl isomerase [Hanstruepera marina]|uniref:peptidylprolyl isomerase n=1 Tax=Hanstruepera marina TaxID=2873265 RepID=UPI001CA76FF8|nr:peptidylprolyl isomerase [Hanstruepera marina]
MIRKFLFVFLALCFMQAHSQVANNDVLFTIADKPVYASEFVRIFNKNLDLVQDESQKDVDEYLNLFINYKLKIAEAKAKGLDKNATYIRELNNYKKQLAKNYLTDTEVTDELVDEAYYRVTNEVKANHILIRMDASASPEDTLLAYNELLNLRDRVKAEGFDKVKRDVHNGKTVYAEELGYFSGFKMVYEFESMAYNTDVGEISMPFKTQFGYHIVIVDDKRESRGERTVAHIMVANKQGENQESAETRINEIYQKIQQGESFEALAKQFSEDKSSAANGGRLNTFSGGQLSSIEFEDVAFGLENPEDISEPFVTEYGWHIIKLIDKQGIKSFQEMKPELEVRVKRDSRSKLIDNSIVSKLKTRYNVTDNEPALAYFESIITKDYFVGKWEIPSDFTANKTLVVIDKKTVSYNDFAQYLYKMQRKARTKKTISDLVKDEYHNFLSQNLMVYQEENLEYENEDFAHIVNEYRDGLLLFDLMETEIWNTAQTDSVELQNYYDGNKEKYYWNERVDAIVASSSDKAIIKQVKKLLELGKSQDDIKKEINVNGEVHVIFSTGIMESTHQALPKAVKFEKGVSKIYNHNDAYVVVKITEVMPKSPKSYDEAKGQIISDYQQVKETEWMKELKLKYPIVINESVLEKVKTQIKSK